MNILDTYLSPEKYRGTELRVANEVVRQGQRRTYTLLHDIAFATTSNRAETTTELAGHYRFAYGVLWRLWHTDAFNLRAGGMATAMLGVCYNDRNQNNPANAYAAADIGPEVLADYTLALARRPLTISYHVWLPALGLMYAPRYGQSYYEMFNRGDYDNNVVFRYIGDAFQVRQTVSLDWQLWQRTALRVQYLCDIQQAKPNNLKYHQYANAVMLGIVLTR